MKKSFFVKTFGCKVNQFESEYFINSLINKNYTLSSKEKDANIIIINSCAVTKEAERQFYQYIRKMKRLYPKKKLVLTGCSIDNNLEKALIYQNENIIISNYYKDKLPILIEDKNIYLYKKISDEKSFKHLIANETFLHTRKFLKIQDGCDNYCSYCIIPFLRGKPRSLPIDKVIENIILLKDKYKEIVLTGINIGIYGKDLSIDNGLLILLENIEDALYKENVKNLRLRLTSLKPDEIREEFINFIKNSRYFAPHFHISIQNFNNAILKLMNRKYTYEIIKEKIELIRANIPLAGIGADIITGFPGEGEKEFQDNVLKMEEIDINFYHIFPFSKREKTLAYKLKETLTKKDKKIRVNILKKIADMKKEKFIKKNLDKNHKVLIESSKGNYLTGYSENYIKFFIFNNGNFELKNNLLNVKGEKIIYKFSILGRFL